KLERQHIKTSAGERPGGWKVQFRNGMMWLAITGRGIYRMPDSPWWQRESAWVSRLDVSGGEDDMFGVGARHPAHTPSLRLVDSRVTADGIRALATLRELILWRGEVTDALLAALASLRLQRLEICPARARQVTDAGCQSLLSQQSLRGLRVNSAAVTGAA